MLYLLARVVTSLARLAYTRISSSARASGSGSWIGRNAFAIEATLVWGAVMALFRHSPGTLQASLQASMQYLYNDSDTWNSLWTLIIHNK